MDSSLLRESEVHDALARLGAWSVRDNALVRDYRFPDFPSAFGFMTVAALHIEKLNHHPNWSNVYNRVAVKLTTHDAGGITALDLQLAHLLDSLAARLF